MIFYFSGTGNCKYVAERLGEMLGMRATSITDVMSDAGTKATGVVGIVCPVYFYGTPSIVNEFISRTDLSDADSVFTVMTHGGTIANASAMLRKRLTKKGANVTHSFEIRMPDNYVPLYHVPEKAVCDKLLSNAEASIGRIPELLKKERHMKKGNLPGKVMSFLLYPLYSGSRDTKRFSVTRKCTGCGKCEKICPLGKITVTDGIPVWEPGKCTKCLACVHRCPSAAIQNGRSRNHGRYVNPNVTFDDE